jgi:4-coumarate--CoA ligase
MRIYKPSLSTPIPRDLNLTELLHRSAPGCHIPPTHLICSDNLTNRSITIGELRDRAGRLAHGIHRHYNPILGDRFALIVPNCVEFVELYHAVLWTGGVVCPINHALKPAEIGHALAISRPKYIFAYGEVLGNICEAVGIARRNLAAKAGIKDFNPQIITVIKKASRHKHAPDDFLDDEKLPIPHYPDTTTASATLHLSSGTTGASKGVLLNHYNYIANCHQMHVHDPDQWHPGSRVIAYTPFVHIAMTTMPLFFGPWTGMHHHAMPSFNLSTLGRLVQEHRATNIQGVASVITELANSDITRRYDFSSVQIIQVGNAPFTEELVKRLHSRGSWKMSFLYGMTEAAPYVSWQKLGEEVPFGATGKLLPNIEALLRKEGTTDDAPEGGPGELWLKGPNIATGYVSVESGVAKTLTDEDGWYNTGDVATISSDGFIAIVGRTKELVKYKGFQVSPVELEALLNEHPLVADAGVAGTWDKGQLTELPVAYVVLKDVTDVGKKEEALRRIQRDIDGAVSGYKKLRGGVWEVESLPRNAQTKILRRRCKEFVTGLNSLGGGKRRGDAKL